MMYTQYCKKEGEEDQSLEQTSHFIHSAGITDLSGTLRKIEF